MKTVKKENKIYSESYYKNINKPIPNWEVDYKILLNSLISSFPYHLEIEGNENSIKILVKESFFNKEDLKIANETISKTQDGRFFVCKIYFKLAGYSPLYDDVSIVFNHPNCGGRKEFKIDWDVKIDYSLDWNETVINRACTINKPKTISKIVSLIRKNLNIKKTLFFEGRVINPILNCIKNNIDYLTQKENLGQLAKLGYMYNTLWYAGRMCYGHSYSNYKVLIADRRQCEDNPKYKLQMCDVGTDEQYDLIYDAWGMHVSNDLYGGDFEYFKNIITGNKEYSEIELMLQQPNKTLYDWINIKLHKDYKYKSLYNSPKSVIDTLLCVIGTEYGYKDGYIIEEASGADQDITLYGQWENTKFLPKIDKVVQKILNDSDVKLVLDTVYKYSLEYKAKEKRKKDEENQERANLFLPIFIRTIKESEELLEQFKIGENIDEDSLKNYANKLVLEYFNGDQSFFKKYLLKKDSNVEEKEPIVKKYREYYPICNFSIITMLDKNSHKSYLEGALMVIKDILENRDKERAENIEYAEKNIDKFINLLK